MEQKYQELYQEFIDRYNKTETTPSEVGETLSRIAGLFPNYNMEMIRTDRAYALVKKNIIEGLDEQSGKPISSAKADTLADATPEATAFKEARGHVSNIEMLIGTLKFLQKSLEVEYINSNLG